MGCVRWTRAMLWTALYACCFFKTTLCQQPQQQLQECDPVPVLRCYSGLLSNIEADMDRLAAKYGSELDAALRTFAGKYPASSSSCKVRPGELGRCTRAEREQLDRIEGVYEVFQRTVNDDQALKDMVAAYRCWDRRKYRDCFASLLQDTLIREYRDSPHPGEPEKMRICRQWSVLAGSCFDDANGALCPESAAAGRQHFRDLMSAYVGSFGCQNAAGRPILSNIAVALGAFVLTRIAALV